MAYLGNVPARSFISFERQVFTIVNSQTVYTLDHSVTNENDIRLVVNNIVQEPGSGKAYTATGTTLTLSAALVNGTDEMYCVFLGRATATNAPGAGSVGTAQIADSSVSLAKLSATGTKDATTFLRGDNTFAAAGLNGWSEDGANNNLLPASASAGIYLGVTTATAANLLDHYEEGSWTPANPNISLVEAYGRYTKIGNLVTIRGFVVIPITSDSNQFTLTGLPFTVSNTDANVQGNISLTTIGTDNAYLVVVKNATTMRLVTNTNSAIANSACSGDFISFSTSYNV